MERQEPACWSWPVPPTRPFTDDRDADQALHDFQFLRGCATLVGLAIGVPLAVAYGLWSWKRKFRNQPQRIDPEEAP